MGNSMKAIHMAAKPTSRTSSLVHAAGNHGTLTGKLEFK
jgi:hypothetical protein